MSEYNPKPPGQAVSFGDIYKLPEGKAPVYGAGSGGNGGGRPPTTPPMGPPPGDSGDSGRGAINGNAAFDLFGTSSAYITVRQPAGQNYMTSHYVPEYNAIRWDLYFNDFSGGVDAQVRPLADGVFSNELAYSTLDAQHSRTMNLPPLVTIDSGSTNSIGTVEAMSACYLNDAGTPRWLAAAGDTANKALFALDDNAGVPRVTAQTYTPGSNIVSLTTVKIATNTERVIVGRAGAAAQVLTGFNGTPTTSGTMHVNTAACWGVIRSPLNSTTPGAETLLMYCGGSGATLYSLSSTAAIGDAPTAVLTNWPSGGYALGIATLSNEGVARAYWFHPLNSQATSALDAMAPGRIVSTNLEGTDPKVVETGLPFVKHALLWRGGIVVTDGKKVHWLNGDIINLGWNKERRWIGNGFRATGTVSCFGVVQDRLFVDVASIFLDDVAFPYSASAWEEYIPEDNTWHHFSKSASNNGPIQNIAAFTGQTPVYQPHNTRLDNGWIFWYNQIGQTGPTFEWEAAPLLPSGVNPNYQQASTAWVFYKYATGTSSACFALTPIYTYMGLPMVVSDIQFMGTLKFGEDAQVTVEIAQQLTGSLDFVADGAATQAAVFVEDNDWKRNWWINPSPESSLMDKLQFKIIVAQGTSGAEVSKTSPNALPIRIGGYCYLDGFYTAPKVVEPRRYWGPPEP